MQSSVERREQPRQQISMRGFLVSKDGKSRSDCIVRNLSQGGALIDAQNPALPSGVYLVVTRDGRAYEAKIMRARGQELALRFLRSFHIEDAKDKGLGFLHQMWLTKR